MSKIILSCQDLYRTYVEGKNKIPVLKGVDFSVEAGTSVGILGVSGSGKSTLLHLLGGLDKPTSGDIFWNTQNIAQFSEKKRCRARNKHLGFVYQFHHLLPEFTALENVAMPLLIGGASIKKAKRLAHECLTAVGLEDRETHKLSELSGGERQRTAIARAIITRPKCVLADEPTGNLDNKTAADILALLISLKKHFDTSFVIVTHDLSIAKQLDVAYTLEEGQLIRSEV